MEARYIKAGRCYIVKFANFPQRRVFVDWTHPEVEPFLFHTFDIQSGEEVMLTAEDFLCPCDEQVSWSEMTRLGAEHRRCDAQHETEESAFQP
jgi:hypothetical protein